MGWTDEAVSGRGGQLALRAAPDSKLDADLSAARVLSRGQAAILTLVLIAVSAGLAVAPATSATVLIVCSTAFCGLAATHELRLSLLGIRSSNRAPAQAPAETELPRYTILVPLYEEAAVVGRLVRALEALDYPKGLLDVKLLVEADDAETIAALQSVAFGPQFEVLSVPPGEPRTKPRACNFGLRNAHGEMVVIFDVEDRPEPDQLKKAVAAFRRAPPDVACFQARLSFWNPTTNLLTRFCAAEFARIFDLARIGLEHVRAPIPLGGTSNHFPLKLLRELGAWDEFNVAEDADLGIRLARAGYRTRFLDSTTYEEANSRIGNWIRQQSRWVKGYIQTWLVHMRHPVQLSRELGARGTVHFQFTMLGPVFPVLLGPVNLALALLWPLAALGVVKTFIPLWVLAAVAIEIAFATTAAVWENTVGLRRRGYQDRSAHCTLFTGYRMLKSVAVAKAICQLVTRPSYWEKTVHGLVRETSEAAPVADR